MTLPDDVVRVIVPRLSLWDARSLQRAYPSFRRLVAERVQCVVDRAVRSPRPKVLDAFLDVPPRFSTRVHGPFSLLRTPRDLAVHYSVEGAVVVAWRHDKLDVARVELRMPVEPTRPTFDTLEHVLAALWWFWSALRARGCKTITFRTRALVHHPVSEVLNTTATTFVERVCGADAQNNAGARAAT